MLFSMSFKSSESMSERSLSLLVFWWTTGSGVGTGGRDDKKVSVCFRVLCVCFFFGGGGGGCDRMFVGEGRWIMVGG